VGELTVVVRPTLDELFARYYPSLVRLAVQLVDDQDTAEDVVQDVFAALGPRELREPLTYLRTAVVNRSRSALRRRKVARIFAGRSLREDLAEPADAHAVRTAERDRMLAAIDALPRRQREAVVLRYYEDLAVTDIAAVLHISPGAVSSALTRALTTLATTLGDRDVG
jgi:RNA polymerase sigma factor (sigma-70 family)